jgi:hypothetical protein
MIPTTISFNSPIDSAPTSPFSDDTGIEPVPTIGPASVEPEPIDISQYYFYVGEARQTNYDVPTSAYEPGSLSPGTEQEKINNDLYVDIEIMVNAPGKNSKLTKRIKLCKQSLAREAMCKDALLNMTATYVESKEETSPKKSSTQRMIELAGIRHPKNFV